MTSTRYVTFDELATKYGWQNAYVVLTLIEKSANVPTDSVVGLDCEERLRTAFDAMRDDPLAA